jgi:uncharacterized protein
MRVLVICTFAALCLLGLGLFLSLHKTPTATDTSVEAQAVVSNGEPLPTTIEVADTPEKRMQGLSGRKEIPDDYGMFFIFDADSRAGFWMKDMYVPIDIIWISADGTIVHIEHSLSPDTYPEIFTPPYPARYVLETRAGYAREHNWNNGTKLDLSTYK